MTEIEKAKVYLKRIDDLIANIELLQTRIAELEAALGFSHKYWMDAIDQKAALYLKLRAREAEAAWIPVSERLPKNNDLVMVWYSDNTAMGVICYCKDEPLDEYISHWRPLPEPPEEE